MPEVLNSDDALKIIIDALTDEENQPHQWMGDSIALEKVLYEAFTPILIAHVTSAFKLAAAPREEER